MQLSMPDRAYAVRKLITMIAERDAAILERNSAVAEKTSAYEERDAALMLRDVAYNDRDSAVEERDAAVAALAIAVNACRSYYVDKRAPARDSKVFQTFGMAKSSAIVGAFHPPAFAASRFSTGGQDPGDLCRIGDCKDLQGGAPRKRKVVVKSALDRTLRAKRTCRPPLWVKTNVNNTGQPGLLELGDGDETEYFKSPIGSEARVDSPRYPTPHCSCTGVKQQCYRWGSGGWQSSCCTTMISMYPLPMNPSKRRSRMAGRKMSAGAFEKLLEKLSSEGINVNYPVDLKDHWAKHGTNRYVTLR